MLDAVLVLHNSDGGPREVRAADYFHGLYETARRHDELLVEVRYPARRDGECSASAN